MKRKSALFIIMILAIILSACATAATQAPAQSLSPMDLLHQLIEQRMMVPAPRPRRQALDSKNRQTCLAW